MAKFIWEENMGILQFYDFEVFKFDWLVVIIDPVEKITTKIVNDSEKLKQYFADHEGAIWVGYNNRRYDQFIMKAILLDMNPKEVNDFIIAKHQNGWQFSSLFRQIKMINFDTMLRTDTGLKSLEAFMGNNIHETSVPFNLERKLTQKEIDETFKYCTHDVEQTIEVFLNRKAEFDAAVGLVKIFNLPMDYVGKTGAQRVAKILGGRGQKFDDEFDFPLVPTLQLGRYKNTAQWYRNPVNQDYRKKQNLIIGGLETTLAWGGIHSAKKKYYGEGLFVMADVTAYYPSLQLKYKFGYRNMGNSENFEKIHRENLRFKSLGDKTARLPYKIADNAISGQLKDVYSPLFDPRENNAITVNGQLLLVDLVDKIEDFCELIQTNTDGILVKLKSRSDYDKLDDAVYEWEKRTGMRMGFDVYEKVYQKDVNNYLLVSPDGKLKTKGAYTKALSAVDNDLPIINKALVDYMTKEIPVEQTINECNDLIMFQKVVKLSGKYWKAWHNNEFFDNKCYRIFASKNHNDTYMGKCKSMGATIEKFGNSPDSCFIFNDAVKDVATPDYLDKDWYINLAKKRLEQYGVNV